MVAVIGLCGCATQEKLAETPISPSPEALRRAESGESEAQCKVGWVYLASRNYAEAARWLQKAAEQGNANSMGAAGRLFVEGRGVPSDLDRGIRYLRQGAEFPDIGGNEECATDLADIYEKGEFVPRNDREAYYFLGVSIAKCGPWDESPAKRRRLIARQKTVGARLPVEEQKKQDIRLRKWLDGLKAGNCRSMGELDSETPDVSVYLDDEDAVSMSASFPTRRLGFDEEIALAKLGKRLQELNVSENATIRVYASVDLSLMLRTKVRKSLVGETFNFPNQEFFCRADQPLAD